MDVISEVVENERCIGCGVCVGVCPRRSLKMTLRNDGDLVARKIGECGESCGLCLRVCPFAAGLCRTRVENERLFGIAAQSEAVLEPSVGWHRCAWVGYSGMDDHRSMGASGGLATWCVETLLTQGLVDRVAVVMRSGLEDERLFRFCRVTSVEDLRRAAGSFYYPVSIDEILRQVAAEPNVRWAVIGVPCLVAGVRRATLEMPKLLAGIRVILGLACGMLPNHSYTELLAARSGVSRENLGEVAYRLPAESRHAGNFRFQCRERSGREGKSIAWSGLPVFLWRTGFFRVNACNYCADVFAEAADACFMDAWLPEYAREFRGTSIVVCRDEVMSRLFREGAAAGELRLEPLESSRVAESQRGQIRRKQDLIRMRTGCADASPLSSPATRGHVMRTDWWLQQVTQRRSRSAWRRWGKRYGTTVFWLAMADMVLLRVFFDGVCRAGLQIRRWLMRAKRQPKSTS